MNASQRKLGLALWQLLNSIEGWVDDLHQLEREHAARPTWKRALLIIDGWLYWNLYARWKGTP